MFLPEKEKSRERNQIIFFSFRLLLCLHVATSWQPFPFDYSLRQRFVMSTHQPYLETHVNISYSHRNRLVWSLISGVQMII